LLKELISKVSLKTLIKRIEKELKYLEIKTDIKLRSEFFLLSNYISGLISIFELAKSIQYVQNLFVNAKMAIYLLC